MSNNETRPAFRAWVMSLPVTDDLRGDLIHEIGQDPHFPSTWAAIAQNLEQSHLWAHPTPEWVWHELGKLWSDYNGETSTGRMPGGTRELRTPCGSIFGTPYFPGIHSPCG